MRSRSHAGITDQLFRGTRSPQAGTAACPARAGRGPDGRPDILLAVSEGIGDLAWFKAPANPVTGTWVASVIDTGLDPIHATAARDFDRDGLLDVDGDVDADIDLFGADAFSVNPVILCRNLTVP